LATLETALALLAFTRERRPAVVLAPAPCVGLAPLLLTARTLTL
jgi:hypothetical protein